MRGSCCDSEKRQGCEQPRHPVPLTAGRFGSGMQRAQVGGGVLPVAWELTGKHQETGVQICSSIRLSSSLSILLVLCKSYIDHSTARPVPGPQTSSFPVSLPGVWPPALLGVPLR